MPYVRRIKRSRKLSISNANLLPDPMRFLVVEDEPLLVMLLEDMLGELGHAVAGTCPSLQTALDAISTESFDAVFLDLNLHGKRANPVAERLCAAGIPFIIATGGAQEAEALGAGGIVLKPYTLRNIEEAIESLRAATR